MTHINKWLIPALLLIVCFVNKTNAQINVVENYVFVNDSVAGFDEAAASVGALANACYGREYKVFMYRAKRNYVKQKYNLKSAPIAQQTLFLSQLASKTATDLAAPPGGACNNEDFELAAGGANIFAPGAVQGWTVQSGTNPNSCLPPILNANNNYTLFTSTTIDPKIGSVSSYFDASSAVTPSGSCFIRLNDDQVGGKASQLSKSFIVTPSNALFQYAYLPVIEDGGHDCCDQPGFNIRITVTNTATGTSSVLTCPQISVAVPGPACSYTPPAGSPVFTTTPNDPLWVYHPWNLSAIDLTAYLGNQVTINVIIVDCTFGGHGAYAYFDAKCAPMNILGNNNSFPAGTTSITLPSCGFSGAAVICAPDGLGPYAWAGPGVLAPYLNSLYTNQCYTTNISGTFSLIMNPPGSCNPIQRVITVTNTPAPLVLASVIQAPCGSTAAVVGYTAAGSAAPNSTITFSPPPISSNISSSIGSAIYPAGTGSVIVTVKDPLGCMATATVFVNAVPPQPTVAIVNVSGSTSITCSSPSIVLSAISGYTYGTLNYFWSSNSFTSSASSVTVTSPSTLITLQVIDPITGCSATRTTNIFQNTTIPTATASPLNQVINCGPGVVATVTGTAISPTLNVTHSWFSPNITVPVISAGQISIFNPAVGTTTYFVTNNINGCSSNTILLNVVSSSGSPTFNVSSAGNFTLGCSTKSLTNISIINPNTTPVGGGAMSFTILPPSFTGPTYTYNAILTQTFNTPGNYTVIVRDNGNLCETRITIPLIQNITPPNILATALTRTLTCFTPSVILEASSTTTPVAYNWGFQNGSNPNNIPNPIITVTANLSQTAITQSIVNTYTLTVTNTDNLCTSNTIITIAQNVRPPLPIINGTGSLTCLINKLTLANGSAINPAPGFFSPLATQATLWQGPTPQIDLINSSFYDALTPGIYTMTVMDLNNGCKTQTTAVVGDNRNYPVLFTNTLVALDCGANLTGVTLSVTALNLKAGDVTPKWITPNPTPNIKGANTMTLTTDGIGEYKLTVTTNSNSCARSIFITVVNGALNAGFNADQVSGYAPLTVNFTNNSSSTSSISGTSSITSVWSFGNGTTKTTTSNISTSALYTQPGTYTVTMYASKGTCLDTAYKVIAIDIPSKLEVPNVFTPNGDNNNDLFFVKSANLTEITALIYDRWGNKVYELTTDKGNIAWDGKTQAGKEAADGVYFYTITAKGKDGQNYDTKGTVSLFR
jgi:gliding motility-associated-like protein